MHFTEWKFHLQGQKRIINDADKDASVRLTSALAWLDTHQKPRRAGGRGFGIGGLTPEGMVEAAVPHESGRFMGCLLPNSHFLCIRCFQNKMEHQREGLPKKGMALICLPASTQL